MDDLAKKTFRLDLLRAPFHGFVQEGLVSLALIVAIRHFDGSNFTKSVMAAAIALGLLVNPLTLSWAVKTGFKVGAIGFAWLALGALATGVAAFAPSLWLFTLCIVIAGVTQAQMAPLAIQAYTHNYEKSQRGKLLSGASFVAAASAGIGTYIAGKVLDHDLAYFPWVLGALALAFVLGGLVFSRFPVKQFNVADTGSPRQNIQWAWKDKIFGVMLTAWMFMGLGNLMTLPLRTEYLANAEYGIDATNAMIFFLTVGLPAAARLLSIPIWGVVFDKINLIVVRIAINVFFIISILFFFISDNIWLIGIASAATGIATAGGQITWALWVTKLAPPDRVSAYMSVHSSFTGIRGVLAPFIGFYVISATSPQYTGYLGTGLVVFATIMFAGLLKHPRFKR